MSARPCHLCREPEDSQYPHRDWLGCIEAMKTRMGNISLKLEAHQRVLEDLGKCGDMQAMQAKLEIARKELL